MKGEALIASMVLMSLDDVKRAAAQLGYDIVPHRPAAGPAIDPVLTALADAGYMPVGDYVAAVTSAPGFDGRALSLPETDDLSMRPAAKEVPHDVATTDALPVSAGAGSLSIAGALRNDECVE